MRDHVGLLNALCLYEVVYVVKVLYLALWYSGLRFELLKRNTENVVVYIIEKCQRVYGTTFKRLFKCM